MQSNWFLNIFTYLIKQNIIFQSIFAVGLLAIIIHYSVVLAKEKNNSLSAFKLHYPFAMICTFLTLLVSVGLLTFTSSFTLITITYCLLNVYIFLSFKQLSVKNNNIHYFNKKQTLTIAQVKAILGTIHFFNGAIIFACNFGLAFYAGKQMVNNQIYYVLLSIFIGLSYVQIISELALGLISFCASISYEKRGGQEAVGLNENLV
ncbi:Transmembrane domain-containing protein [Spironucleus salmonicida]|uniref:Transmembrane domain-containing protein n=1 Tax=Spironucleus salmonicida TaxID=348837 RepID=V6LQZ1_9EUKA|nr:Transmembrane domain-containing protein [Spironucleus salmonicida]|eukprot:EST47097.1 Transmembrane domain-containing protein [Spironucleus salmonicida]